MAAVPLSFDQRYFTTRVMAPDSEKLNCHRNVRLKYPRDVSREFLAEFQRLMNGLESYLSR